LSRRAGSFEFSWRTYSLVKKNGDPSLCATIYTAGGVGELYQRRSAL